MNATDVRFHGGGEEIVLFKAFWFFFYAVLPEVFQWLMHSVMNTAVHLCGLITFMAIYLTEKTSDVKDHPVL